MFIELVDALRCPKPHEESWLVLAADEMDARDVVRGRLGCPVCRAEYAIVDGAVRFVDPVDASTSPAPTASAEDGLRLAAFLGLVDGEGFAVLTGAWAACAAAVRALVDVPLVLVDPPTGTRRETGTSVLWTGGRLPFADGSARAVAVDERGDARALARRVHDGARIVRVRGRVVAPAESELPPGLRELARDARLWVAERSAPAAAESGIVRLETRAGRERRG